MILFIASQETDYLQDLTYSGLAQILGKEFIVDFPFHWQYHQEKRFIWSSKNCYPKNLGFVPEKEFKSSCNRSKGFVQIKELLRKNHFRLVILGAAKPDALRTFHELSDLVRAPWIFIDGGDWQEVGGDFKRTGGEESFNCFLSLCNKIPPAAIFKREVPINKNLEKLFPLPFSVSSQVPILKSVSKKIWNVVFWAVESSSTRKKVFELLKDRYDCKMNGSISGQKFKDYNFKGNHYFKALNEAKIALSFRGGGFDTLRYWEIPACGSLLISEKPFIQIPNNFIHGEHALFCKNDLSDLTHLIDTYLLNEKDSQAISEEGQKHLLKYHTDKHRAQYLLELLNSKLNLNFKF